MSLVVVGSIALDTIETPHDRVDHALGGSAVHFALAAALLAEVRAWWDSSETIFPTRTSTCSPGMGSTWPVSTGRRERPFAGPGDIPAT